MAGSSNFRDCFVKAHNKTDWRRRFTGFQACESNAATVYFQNHELSLFNLGRRMSEQKWFPVCCVPNWNESALLSSYLKEEDVLVNARKQMQLANFADIPSIDF
ncbi:hypothetical protein D918_07273 [Trichuris suis]|nr:hypothetical protein D918_07273 [Trichuris suis]